jgi:hypothetical protein
MNIDIKSANDTFDFTKIHLGDPVPIFNGFYFSPIKHGKELYIQTPEIYSKNGFVKSSNKNYIDLLFDNTHEEILEWFENLESTIKGLIYEKKDQWFSEPDIEMSDIENIFISPIRTYKSGKQFVVRTNVESVRNALVNKHVLKIYNEHQNEIQMDEVDNNTRFIGLIHISGIKFSARTFQVYIEIKQVMTVGESTTAFNSCLIAKRDTTSVRENIASIPDEIPLKETTIITQQSVEETNPEAIQEATQETTQKETQESTQEVISELETTGDHESLQLETHPEEADHTQPQQVLDECIENESEIVPAVPETSETSETSETLQELCENTSDLSLEETHTEEKNMKNEAEETIQKIVDDVVRVKTLASMHDGSQNSQIDDINEINELHLEDMDLDDANISIKEPEQEYIELYKAAISKAKTLRKQALLSHMEAQNIKAKYLLDIYSDTDSDYSEQESEEADIVNN